MRPTQLMRLPTVLCVLLLLMGSPLILWGDLAKAGPHGGSGGFHGSLGGNGFHGGFGGGSFRPQSIHPSGFEARQHAQPGPHPGPPPHPGPGTGPHPGPHPGSGPHDPHHGGWGAYYGGWGPYYGGYGWDFGDEVAAALAVGTVVGALAANVQTLIIGDQIYYFDGTNYYQACYQGIDSSYCVVPNPYE